MLETTQPSGIGDDPSGPCFHLKDPTASAGVFGGLARTSWERFCHRDRKFGAQHKMHNYAKGIEQHQGNDLWPERSHDPTVN